MTGRPESAWGAEQAGRALGEGQRRRPSGEDIPQGYLGVRNPRWNVLLLVTAIVTFIEDYLRAERATPPSTLLNACERIDAGSSSNAYSPERIECAFLWNAWFYIDIKLHIKPHECVKLFEDSNHNGRIEGDNGDGKYESSESWTEISPNMRYSDCDGIRDKFGLDHGYHPLSGDTNHEGMKLYLKRQGDEGDYRSVESLSSEKSKNGSKAFHLIYIRSWSFAYCGFGGSCFAI